MEWDYDTISSDHPNCLYSKTGKSLTDFQRPERSLKAIWSTPWCHIILNSKGQNQWHLSNTWESLASLGPQGIQIRINQAKELLTCLTCGRESRLRVELSTREEVKYFNSVLGWEAGQSGSMIGKGGEWRGLSGKVQVPPCKKMGVVWGGTEGW